MAKDTFYTAVDIGTDKVTSVVARVGSEGELKVMGTGVVPSEGVQRGGIDNIGEVQASVRASLDEAQRYIGKAVVSGIYASVGGTHISCLNTRQKIENPNEVGDIKVRLLDRLVKGSFPEIPQGQDVLHVIPIGYHVDGMTGVRNPVGLFGSQVEVEAHVVLGDSTVLKNTVKAVETGKATVKSLVLQSLASAEATLMGDEREMGAVLVDIGAGTTDVIIYRQGNPWYSTIIPVGGFQLTKDLSVALHSSLHLAEGIKVKWGSVLPESVPFDEEVVIPASQGGPRNVISRRDLAEPLHARMVEILKMMLLKVRQAGLREMPNGGLVFTGGGAEIDGLAGLAHKMLGVPVRIAHPEGISGLPVQLRKPAFSTAVGLLLWGIKHQGEAQPSFAGGNRSRRSNNSRRGGLGKKYDERQEVRVG